MKSPVTVPLLVGLLLASACADRSANDGVPDAAAPDPIGNDESVDPPTSPDTDEPDDTTSDPFVTPDSPAREPTTDTDGGPDPVIDPAPSPPGTTDRDGDIEPVIDTIVDRPSELEPDVLDDQAIAVPAFPGRPDAARLYAAMTDIVGNALLDLNRRLSEGTPLTARQDDCLGAYDPAFGEPLLAIDCERPLATEPYTVVRVGRGALAATDVCVASLAAGTVIDCVLVSGELSTSTAFAVPPPPARRPLPVDGSGIVVRHAIEPGVFEVGDDDGPLAPDFLCAWDIVTGTRLPTSRGNCERLPRSAADYLDSLVRSADQAVAEASSRSR